MCPPLAVEKGKSGDARERGEEGEYEGEERYEK